MKLKSKSGKRNLRLNLLLIILFLWGIAVFSRLFWWQIIQKEKLLAQAENQHWFNFQIPAGRGEIKTSDGFSLVTNQPGFLIYASLPKIKEPLKSIAEKLGPFLAKEKQLAVTKDENEKEKKSEKNTFDEETNIEKEVIKEIEKRLNTQNVIWVALANKVDEKIKKEIENLKLTGIGFEKEEKRFYPEASMAAHLLGFVGSDINGNDKGYFGLEGFYNLELAGRPGKRKMEKDARGKPILIGEEKTEPAGDGRNLILNLERNIQFSIEKYLQEGMEKYGAKAGTAIVMKVDDGRILAMSSFPSYNPSFWQFYDKNLYKNPTVADLYEPGSVMKPVIMASALNEKLVQPDTSCDKCSGPRSIGGYTIRTFNNQYHPNLTMKEVLENSDNTGMVFVAEKLGTNKLYEYLQKFGFGENSGIDVQEEEGGSLRPKNQWHEIDLATAGFGQGVAVNAIQMVRAFAVFANGGKLVKPFIVKRVEEEGKIMEIKPKIQRQVISPGTAKIITEMLVSTVEKSPLRFPRNRIEGLSEYRIAAKSGTAQIPLAGHYDPKKTIASVIGYGPADNPKFVVLVKLVEPEVRPWGSDTAGPVFFKIMKELFTYYNINP